MVEDGAFTGATGACLTLALLRQHELALAKVRLAQAC